MSLLNPGRSPNLNPGSFHRDRAYLRLLQPFRQFPQALSLVPNNRFSLLVFPFVSSQINQAAIVCL